MEAVQRRNCDRNKDPHKPLLPRGSLPFFCLKGVWVGTIESKVLVNMQQASPLCFTVLFWRIEITIHMSLCNVWEEIWTVVSSRWGDCSRELKNVKVTSRDVVRSLETAATTEQGAKDTSELLFPYLSHLLRAEIKRSLGRFILENRNTGRCAT